MTTVSTLETINADGTKSPVNSTTPLPVSVVASSASVNGMVSTGNSSVANLAGAAVFTGTSTDLTPYGSFNVYVYADQASATNGMSLQQSNDGTNWFITDTYSIPATTAKVFQSPRQAQFGRVVYTNGATPTTVLKIQTILNTAMGRVSALKPGDAVSVENDLDWTLSAGQVYNGTTLDLTRSAINGTNSVGTGILSSGTMAQFDDVSIVSITENSFGNVRMSADHILYVADSPTTSAGTALTSVATATVLGSLVIKASAGNLYGINTVSGAAAGYLMLFDATSAPADGAVTPVKCLTIAATSSLNIAFNPPLRFATGITAVFSTTGPFLKTISATAFISGDAK